MEPIKPEFTAFLASQEPELANGLAEFMQSTTPAVGVRVNPRKATGLPLGVLQGATPVAWCDHSFILPLRPDFTHDPALHQGLYYVQDPSSMITSTAVAHIVKLIGELREENSVSHRNAPLRYLDACAAPGGKTTAAIDALPDGSLVVANEYDFRRAEILKENLIKWGYPNVVVSRGDTSRFTKLNRWFDIIAADVPCSGEGMMRKDEGARLQWSEALVRECAQRQKEILTNLWQALAPGGWLIYSTCTFNHVENEEIVEWLSETFGAETIPVPVPADSGIVVRDNCMRFLPTRLQGEGLFMAVLRKPLGEDGGQPLTSPAKNKLKITRNNQRDKGETKATIPAGLRDAIAPGFDFITRGDSLYAFPAKFATELQQLESVLDVINRGIEAGYTKGRTIAPAHPLAMSTALQPQAFPAVEVDLPTALSYLRREALGGFDAPRGHIMLTHNSIPLGFINHLGNRSNNLYPQPWRILK